MNSSNDSRIIGTGSQLQGYLGYTNYFTRTMPPGIEMIVEHPTLLIVI
ncbi:MAG: hypothetical protein QXU13_02315 [Desulfurococcaceae archaeon]